MVLSILVASAQQWSVVYISKKKGLHFILEQAKTLSCNFCRHLMRETLEGLNMLKKVICDIRMTLVSWLECEI